MSENITEVEFKKSEEPKKYTISEASDKLNISNTKINHWIFKLNKANEGFFSNPSLLSTDELDKIELAQAMLSDGYSYDDVVKYFNDKSKGLITAKEDGTQREITKMDSQVIAKSVTLEVKKHTDRVIDVIRDEIAIDISTSFKEEATKIAQVSLEAMNKSKVEMIEHISELKDQNNEFKREIERIYSRQTEDLRKKLEQKEKELEESKNRTIWSWFKRK